MFSKSPMKHDDDFDSDTDDSDLDAFFVKNLKSF